MSNDLMQHEPAGSTGLVTIESQRAIAEIQAMVVMAKKFPRDTEACTKEILKNCESKDLAEAATYTYSRGGQSVTGPSVRLAEAMAQSYDNFRQGWEEVSRGDDYSEIRAYAWDIQRNTGKDLRFRVGHYRDTKQGKKRLSDERDIYENNANMAARRVRQCILAVMPLHLQEAALRAVEETLRKVAQAEPIEATIRKMLKRFEPLKVTAEMIERRLGHSLKQITDDELADLRGIYNSLRDNVSSLAEWFEGAAGPAAATSESPLAGELEKEKQGKGSTEQKQTESAPQNAPGTTGEGKKVEPSAATSGTATGTNGQPDTGAGKNRKPMTKSSPNFVDGHPLERFLLTGYRSKNNGKEIVGMPKEEKGIALYELHFLEPGETPRHSPCLGSAVPGAPRYICDAWEKYYNFFEENKNYEPITEDEPKPAGAPAPVDSPKSPDQTQAPAGSSLLCSSCYFKAFNSCKGDETKASPAFPNATECAEYQKDIPTRPCEDCENYDLSGDNCKLGLVRPEFNQPCADQKPKAKQ